MNKENIWLDFLNELDYENEHEMRMTVKIPWWDTATFYKKQTND